jgi:large subunit ribosomal protein L21
MYAIIETDGKQYKVGKDSVIEVERLAIPPESAITFGNVLLVCDNDNVVVGAPFVKGAKVIGECLRNFKGKKITSFKFRRRKSSKTKAGHRQRLSRVRIKEILAG